MNSQPDPTAKFLVGTIAGTLRIFLTPFYYAARSDMGVQWGAFTQLLLPGAMHIAACISLAIVNEANVPAIRLYFWLFVLGFIRNLRQARQRRRVRDWSVHSWSAGRPLVEPLLLLFCRAAYRKWGRIPRVRRLLFRITSDDFIYYYAEPSILLLGAWGLWSIGVTLWFYPIILAAALISGRSDAKLAVYLKAHEVMDGQKMERSIKNMLAEPASVQHGIPVAQIAAASAERPATDNRSVFERLSPDLQLLLTRDRAAKP
jgi:hypothetical protein